MSTIESVSHETRVFEPPREFVAQANVTKADFDRMNAAAAADYSGFWAKLARDERALAQAVHASRSDERKAPFYKWFEDGELNVSYNCLERNLANGNADKVAIIFEADDGAVTRVTYQSSTTASAASRTGSSRSASRRATASSSTCRCRSKASSRCRPAPASARRTRSCSAVSRRKSLQERIIDAGAVAGRSPPTSRCAAASRCR